MIQSFKCSETEKLFSRIKSKKLPNDIQNVALRKLKMLDAAVSINDLRIPPSNMLKTLSGNLKGLYSIRINKQWRICFRWENSDAYDVEIVDYH